MHDLGERWFLFFNKTGPNLVLRLAVMFFGVAIMSFAIALTRTTGLGTSPISCVPATLSFMTPLTIGTWSFLINVAFVAVQVILLRRDFSPWQLLQIPAVLVFSVLIDVFVPVTQQLPMPNYPVQLAYSVAGCLCTAVGVFLTVKARLLTLPGEGITLAVSKTTGVAFPTCKLVFDCTNAAVAATLSLVFMGGLYGVREGTLISLFVGVFVGLLGRLLPNFDRFCPTAGHITLTATDMGADPQGSGSAGSRGKAGRTAGSGDGAGAPDAVPVVVTIARQYGSGGRWIGSQVAKRLGVKSYDESLIELTAKQSGLTPAYVREHGESLRRGLLYSLYMQNYAFIGEAPSETDTLFLAQATVITKLAREGGCVVVGRCADAILASRPNVLNVYVHAPLDKRVEHVMERDSLSRAQAFETIDRIDRERASHTRVYAKQEWGKADNYHLCIDSSLATPAQIADLIAEAATRAPIPSKSARQRSLERLETE